MRTRIWKGTVLLLSIQVISPFIPPSGARADSFDVTVVRGLSTIGNPFDHGSNLISEVLANVPEGTQLYKFDASGQGWKVNLFQFGAWVHPEQKLAPGEGAFLRNPTNDFSVTFSGARPSNFVVPVHPGFNLVSVPGDGTNNLSPIDYDYILPFNSSRQQYDESINYVEGAGWFTSTGQVYSLVRAGEAFIYHRGSVSEPVPTPLSTTIFLNNYGPGSTTHAPITSTYGCFWNTFLAQLYAGPLGSDPANFVAVGDPIPLFASTGPTFIDTHVDALRVMTNWQGYYQFRVWDNRQGGNSIFWGSSGIFPLSVLNGGIRPPQILEGLKPFVVGPLSTFYTYGPPIPGTNRVFDGQPAQFSISMISLGLGIYSFQWQRLTASNTWADLPGADAMTFTIPSVQKTDAGRYRAVSSYECASGATQAGLLIVLDRPSLQASPVSGGAALMLNGSGPSGYSYQIETSDDLAHWTNFTEVTNAPASWELVITNAPGLSQRFFRVRILP